MIEAASIDLRVAIQRRCYAGYDAARRDIAECALQDRLPRVGRYDDVVASSSPSLPDGAAP
jgi:hypothetical protein